MPEWVGHGDPATAVPVIVFVAVLETRKASTEAFGKYSEPSIHVDVMDISRAIAVRRHRKEQRGAQEIGDLEASVVLAVPECRHLKKSGIAIAIGLELLREHGVGNGGVGRRGSAVSDHQAAVSRALKEVLEVLADCLHRERVNRSIVALSPDLLDPDSTENLGVVMLEKIQERIEEADRLSPIAFFGTGSQRASDVRSLDLGENAPQTVLTVTNEARVESRLELDELACQALQESLIHYDAGDNERGRDAPVWRSGDQVTRVSGLVYVADPQRGVPQ